MVLLSSGLLYAEGESINHLFLHCPVANVLWSSLKKKAAVIGPLAYSCSVFSRQEWVGFEGSIRGSIIWNIAAPSILWVIWEEGNNRIFSDKFSKLGHVG